MGEICQDWEQCAVILGCEYEQIDGNYSFSRAYQDGYAFRHKTLREKLYNLATSEYSDKATQLKAIITLLRMDGVKVDAGKDTQVLINNNDGNQQITVIYEARIKEEIKLDAPAQKTDQ